MPFFILKVTLQKLVLESSARNGSASRRQSYMSFLVLPLLQTRWIIMLS